uniref:Germin-like protein n=1 Tax=Chenopodium quinoa TaxID=63459 RepID=A0A803L2T2_CHEQI
MAQIKVVLLVIYSLYIFLANASDPDPIQDFCIPSNNSIPLRATNSPHFHIPPCKPLAEVTPEDFIFSGIKHPGNFSEIGFAGISVTPLNFPSLNTLGMSFARADLNVGGVNVPHLHPRGLETRRLRTWIFAKVIEAGEVMVYPRGLVHFQMNVGKSPAKIIGSFNSQNPGIIKIPNVLFGAGVNDELLEKAFGMTLDQISTIRKKFFPKRVT